MMEPITTAALSAGLVSLAKSALDAAAGKVGDAAMAAAVAYWPKVKLLLGIAADPAPDKLEDEIGKAVYNKPEVREQLQELLEKHGNVQAALVGSAYVGEGNIIVTGKHVGPINLDMNFHNKE
jgi:hypothetical protein